MSKNRQGELKKSFSKHRIKSGVTAPNQLLWALVGLLLTIAGTFIEAFVTNPPWYWTEQGVSPQSLGITYQIGGVLLAGCLGGQNAGAISQIAYVVLGLFWLPIFAQGGGIEYLKEPSFGYILGFIPGAWFCGWLALRRKAKLETLAFSSLAGLLSIHLVGIIYLVGLSSVGLADKIAPENLQEVIIAYSVQPLPEQLVMVCAVAVAAFVLRKILFY